MSFQDHIQRAVDLSGSQAKLARKAGISQQQISWLLSGDARNVTAEVAVKIEKATNGAITRHHLRPDLFGEAA